MLNKPTAPLSRRERLRAQTFEEIQQRAFEIVDADGAQAVSLAAIAKAMGMSAPALYRYFPSRDALLAGLVTGGYADLSEALERAAAQAARRRPPARLHVIASAYRSWALTHPRRYTMLFADRPDDAGDSPEAVSTISRGMDVLLGAILDLREDDTDLPSATTDPLAQQVADWAVRRGHPDASPDALRLAILTWTRLHGIVGLEITGALHEMGLDAHLLLDAEIDAVLRAGQHSALSTRPAS